MTRSLLVSSLAVGLLACGDEAAPPADAGPRDFGPEPLAAALSVPRHGDVGATLVLDATASTGGVRYVFDLGDGRRIEDDDGAAEATWDVPGRYAVVVTVEGASGATRAAGAPLTITVLPRHVPVQSGTLTRLEGDRFAAVVRDADQITVAALDLAGELALERRIDTPDDPRTLTAWRRDDGEWLAVPCRDSLLLVRADDGARHVVPLPRASRPYAALPRSPTELWVSLQGTGELVEIAFEGAPVMVRRVAALPDARALALLPDDRVAVSRWRSPDEGAVIGAFEPATGELEELTLQVDPQPGSDTESGGVPSYLDAILVSPDGQRVVVPSLQANFREGLYRSGTELRSDTTLRGVISTLVTDGASWAERFESRRQLDDRGLLSAGVFSSRGDFLFVAARGARVVERIDILGDTAAGSILGTGFAPDGLALSRGDRFLVVHASLSRRLEVYDVSDFTALPRPVSMLDTVDAEPLSPQLLLGKQLFNDAADPRITRDSYLACAHCHLEGDSDHRVWDFTQRGEGLRRTQPLFGRMEQVPFHWSGNFDELQDFENDIRLHFDGRGLMDDADFESTAEPFGEPKAGRSEDLDALVAYLRSLDTPLPSPEREPDGSLGPAAARGEAIFADAGCPGCHAAPSYTDGAIVGGAPILHDVGTITEASGGRLGQPLEGLDTPSLHGLWHQPRYLHDGSAGSLEAVLTTRNPTDAHGTTSTLSADELADLVAFLRSL